MINIGDQKNTKTVLGGPHYKYSTMGPQTLYIRMLRGVKTMASMRRMAGDSEAYLWLVGNGRMVVRVVIIVPHSSIPNQR